MREGQRARPCIYDLSSVQACRRWKRGESGQSSYGLQRERGRGACMILEPMEKRVKLVRG